MTAAQIWATVGSVLYVLAAGSRWLVVQEPTASSLFYLLGDIVPFLAHCAAAGTAVAIIVELSRLQRRSDAHGVRAGVHLWVPVVNIPGPVMVLERMGVPVGPGRYVWFGACVVVALAGIARWRSVSVTGDIAADIIAAIALTLLAVTAAGLTGLLYGSGRRWVALGDAQAAPFWAAGLMERPVRVNRGVVTPPVDDFVDELIIRRKG